MFLMRIMTLTCFTKAMSPRDALSSDLASWESEGNKGI